MKNLLVSYVALGAMLVCSGGVLADDTVISIDIQVSPNVINIASESTVVTVHTNIPYSWVAGASVTLNDIPIDWWKSDDRGYFVAKFDAIAVKDKVAPGENPVSLKLLGTTTGGQSFAGTDSVKVISVKGK